MKKRLKAAAIQIYTKIADSSANIASCERLALLAVQNGAAWIALPEFFNTGVAWNKKLVEAIQTSDGPAASFLQDFSARHHVVIGGSFLCRIASGAVHNRYMAFSNGTLIGQHDKDLPTMWENAFYEGGDTADIGVLGNCDDVRVGAAVCWEFMRTMTARRLRNKVDIIMGGSCWWSIPEIVPRFIRTRWETENALNAISALQDTARLIGSPVIHAAHCGRIECPMFGLPVAYRGYYEGNAVIIDGTGRIIARRSYDEGEGFVSAEIIVGDEPLHDLIPNNYWLRARGFLPWIAWHYQRWLGRHWYRKHVIL